MTRFPWSRRLPGDAKLPGTILRLPGIYGPGDPLQRFHPVLKRIDDGRKRDSSLPITWRLCARLAATWKMSPQLSLWPQPLSQAAGRVYNVCEAESFGELDWAR